MLGRKVLYYVDADKDWELGTIDEKAYRDLVERETSSHSPFQRLVKWWYTLLSLRGAVPVKALTPVAGVEHRVRTSCMVSLALLMNKHSRPRSSMAWAGFDFKSVTPWAGFNHQCIINALATSTAYLVLTNVTYANHYVVFALYTVIAWATGFLVCWFFYYFWGYGSEVMCDFPPVFISDTAAKQLMGSSKPNCKLSISFYNSWVRPSVPYINISWVQYKLPDMTLQAIEDTPPGFESRLLY